MSCGKGLCQECATTWDDINYCTACLAEKRRSSRKGSSWIAGVPVALAAAALFWMVSHLLVWSAVNTRDLWR
jgi:hypothetical protein